MNKKRGLIRSHPYLLIFSILVLLIFWLPVFTIQDLPKRGWTTYLEDDDLGLDSYIEIDDQGRIWVSACSKTISGLYMFNGSDWNKLPGDYCDLASGPDGRLWAAAKNGYTVTVFDGEQRTTWINTNLGIDPGDKIKRIEIDQSGGLWMTLHLKNIDTSTSPAETQLVRVILEDGKTPVLTRYPELLPFEGGFSSLDADSQGSVWVGVWKSDNPENSIGFNVFDGKEWLTVGLPASEKHKIVQTALDKEGIAWLATVCGDIYKQAEDGWERVIEGFEDPDSFSPCDMWDDTNTKGITFDTHGRLWAWGNNMVRYLDGDQWITFTWRNSGIGRYVSGVVFDEQDRIWVASLDGVSMTDAENLQPLPKIMEDYLVFVEEHYWWGDLWWGEVLFIPFMLVLLWLAAYFGMLPGILLAFGAGLAATVILHMYLGIFISICGAIGGFIGGRKQNLNLAIVGSIIGFVIGLIFILFLGF